MTEGYNSEYELFLIFLSFKNAGRPERMGHNTCKSMGGGKARNWPRPIVRDDQQFWKDEFILTELVLQATCPTGRVPLSLALLDDY